jgi:hypothetical protein
VSDIVERLRSVGRDYDFHENAYIYEAADEIERLRAVLRPLLEACENDFMCDVTEAGDTRDGDDEPVSFTLGGIGCDLTFGHIRRARAALAKG